MSLQPKDPVRIATAEIADDALVAIAQLGRKTAGSHVLDHSEASLVFMAFGPMAEELLRRRQHMRAINALAADNVVYLPEQG
ncbi:hypothetical protein [Sagittula sp. P11]|uniref:hypothetical protein n=1 Tax=Sagittula sp. P11 TaxID=2009329 RepID=UPI0012FD1B2B|nr:hypothetical protein [Sagittula sp. P11]